MPAAATVGDEEATFRVGSPDLGKAADVGQHPQARAGAPDHHDAAAMSSRPTAVLAPRIAPQVMVLTPGSGAQ